MIACNWLLARRQVCTSGEFYPKQCVTLQWLLQTQTIGTQNKSLAKPIKGAKEEYFRQQHPLWSGKEQIVRILVDIWGIHDKYINNIIGFTININNNADQMVAPSMLAIHAVAAQPMTNQSSKK